MHNPGACVPLRAVSTLAVACEIYLPRDMREFFATAFAGETVPPDIRRAAERVVASYGICGICDPMYIANIIAVELGRGDGNGRFYPKKGTQCLVS